MIPKAENKKVANRLRRVRPRLPRRALGNLFILLAYWLIVACPTQSVTPGGLLKSRGDFAGAAGAAGPDGGGDSTGSGSGSSEEGGGAVGGGGAGEGGSGGGGGAAGGDVVAEAPPIPGNPMGTMPGPHCYLAGTEVYFETQIAATRNRDEKGRWEILAKTFLYTKAPSHGEEKAGSERVEVSDLSFEPPKSLLNARTYHGCLFLKFWVPESAIGRTIRLQTSVPGCAEGSDLVYEGGEKLVMMKKAGSFGAKGVFQGHHLITAFDEIVLANETPETSLEPCPYDPPSVWPPKGYLDQQIIEQMIEKRQNRQEPTPNPAKAGIPNIYR